MVRSCVKNEHFVCTQRLVCRYNCVRQAQSHLRHCSVKQCLVLAALVSSVPCTRDHCLGRALVCLLCFVTEFGTCLQFLLDVSSGDIWCSLTVLQGVSSGPYPIQTWEFTGITIGCTLISASLTAALFRNLKYVFSSLSDEEWIFLFNPYLIPAANLLKKKSVAARKTLELHKVLSPSDACLMKPNLKSLEFQLSLAIENFVFFYAGPFYMERKLGLEEVPYSLVLVFKDL